MIILRSGHYVMFMGQSMYEDLQRSVTPEVMAQWDLQDEWDNMAGGWEPVGERDE